MLVFLLITFTRSGASGSNIMTAQLVKGCPRSSSHNSNFMAFLQSSSRGIRILPLTRSFAYDVKPHNALKVWRESMDSLLETVLTKVKEISGRTSGLQDKACQGILVTTHLDHQRPHICSQAYPRLSPLFLKIGVFTWSFATTLVPLLAGYMPGLLLSRILVGMEKGAISCTYLISKFFPVFLHER